MRNTKIVHQVTLKHMKMNMKRTLISVIGIALMVMLLTTVLVGKDTAYRYFVDIASAKKGAYHYAVYNLDKEKLEKLKDLDEVAYVRFASVYRQFKDVNTFIAEIEKLLGSDSAERKKLKKLAEAEK